MTQIFVLAAAIAVVIALFRGSARTAFVILVAAIALVPPGLKVPNDVSSQLLLFRFIVVAFVLGTAVRDRREGLTRSPFGRTPLDPIFVVYGAVVLVVGVVLAAPGGPLTPIWTAVLGVAEQIVLFYAVLAALRRVGDVRWCVGVVLAAFTVTASIALLERATSQRIVSSLFGHLVPPDVGASIGERGGQVRPTSTYGFPQELGLVLACLVPLGLVMAATTRRAWVWFTITAVLAGTALLTISRSSVVALGLGAALLVLLSRRGATRWLVVGGLTVLAVGALFVPGARRAYHAPDTVASSSVRRQRLPIVGALVAGRPWTGVGLNGISSDVGATDNQYERTYAELGVIGLSAGGLLWIGAVAVAAFGIRGRGFDREVGAACFAGLLAALVAASSIDLFDLGGARMFWLLAGLGCYAAERAGPFPAIRRIALPVPAIAGVVAVLVAGGVVASIVAPRHAVTTLFFETWPVSEAVTSQRRVFLENQDQAGTVCALAHHLPDGRRAVAVTCAETPGAPGVGTIRITESTKASGATVDALTAGLAGLPGFRVHVLSHTRRALANPVRTAPLWLGAAGLALLVMPWLGPRDEERVAEVEPAGQGREPRSG